MNPKPKTIKELVEFYYEVVKPLYSTVQLTNELPSEVLFEINAAFDHVTRMWAYEENEEEVVSKAHSHLKRSCLDIFKLAVKSAVTRFGELKQVNTSIIDNGKFDRELIALFSEIKAAAKNARQCEGDPRRNDGDTSRAFDLWYPVYDKCVRLEKDFYEHPGINWAAKIESTNKWKERFIGFIFGGIICGIIAGLATAYIYDSIKPYLRFPLEPSQHTPATAPTGTSKS